MRILHTSDFHIGKKLEGRDRLDEQKAVLEEILCIIERENIELVLCAGDVFDNYIPSARAEQLYFEYAKKFAANGRAFVVISGNHDDSDRLVSSVPLSQELNIFTAGNQSRIFMGNKESATKLVESGEGYLIFENKSGERVFINLLPYPSEYRFKEDSTNGDYLQKMSAWLEFGRAKNTDNLPEITVAHIFTLGGESTSGEREIELGGARAFPPKMLPKSDYIALGHLHKFQKVTDKCYYSGSILRYAFDENEDKYVVTFDLSDKKSGMQSFTKHPLKSGKKLLRVSASSLEHAKNLLEIAEDAYVELTLNLDRPLGHSEHKELSGCFPNLLKIITVNSESEQKRVSRKDLSYKEMFTAYYRYKFSTEPPKDLMELYLELMEGEKA